MRTWALMALTVIVPRLGVAQTAADSRIREVTTLVADWRPDLAREYVVRAYEPTFRDAFPMAVHLSFLGEMAAVVRSAALHSVESTGEIEASALLYAPLLEEWRTFSLEVEPEEPHRITGLRPLRVAEDPTGGEHGAGDAKPSAETLDAYVRRLTDADLFSGAVLVARDGDVSFRRAYGMASREFWVDNTPETRFILGSINKMFTAVAVLQLAERGLLSLDAPASTYLDGVLAPGVAERVRVRHLLTHTSGLGDFLFTREMHGVNRARYRTIADYIPLLGGDTVTFEPGTRWRYSNTGYLLLGAIIEAVSGETYYDYVERHILKPAGMADTGWPELDRVPQSLASNYERTFDGGIPGFRSDRYEQVVKGTPAGGGFSTLDDMHRFARALMDGRLLPAEAVQRMLTAKPEWASPGYGFGAQIFDGGWVGHTGGGPGTADFFAFHPETRGVVVVMGNQNGQSGAVLRQAQRLAGR